MAQDHQCRYRFGNVDGYFAKHPPLLKDDGYRAETSENFGLLSAEQWTQANVAVDASLTTWQSFQEHVRKLNHDSPSDESYKVVILTRHGEGFHNVQEVKVGRVDWETHWALLDGDGTTTWADSELTDLGIQQARTAGEVWSKLITEEKLSWPSIYCSPLRRCLKTNQVMLSDLAKKYRQPFHPVVKELLRERMGRHTCDRRSTRSWIAQNYPEYLIEPGFSETDMLFKPESREGDAEHVARTQVVLEDIFENDPSQLISITMHSMASRAFMRVADIEEFRLAPGTTIAFLVKAKRV